MNETPDDPRLPDEGGGDDEPRTEHDLPAEAEIPAEPPYEPVELPPLSPLGDLPPLDDAMAVPEKRRLLSGGRLAVAAVAVLALVGGTAFALTSGSDDSSDDDGIASVTGSDDDDETDSDGSSDDGSEPTNAEFEDAMLEYAQCMRDNGVDMPDPEFGPDGGGMAIGGPGPESEDSASRDKFAAAEEACDPILEAIGANLDPPSPEEIAEMQDQMVAMAECMREKGYDMPDPEVTSDGGVQVQINSDEGIRSPEDEAKFEQDQDECHEEAGLEGPEDGPGLEGGS